MSSSQGDRDVEVLDLSKSDVVPGVERLNGQETAPNLQLLGEHFENS